MWWRWWWRRAHRPHRVECRRLRRIGLRFVRKLRQARATKLSGKQIDDAVLRPAYAADRTIRFEDAVGRNLPLLGVECKRRAACTAIKNLRNRLVARA